MTDEIFDLDALSNEANQKPFQFRFDGVVYTCPDDISIEIIQSFSDVGADLTGGDILKLVQMILGEDQWAQIVASPKVFGVARMSQMLSAYQKHLGVEVPNS